MKDQQGKYSNESRTETGKKPPDFLKQAWKLLYKSLTGWEGNYINISLQREYKANTGLFDDSEKDSREIQTLTACTFFLLELSERLSPDFSTVNKLHEVREPPNLLLFPETGLKIAV